MIDIRKSNERGHINFGWLDTKHSFSFGQYYDPKHMGFSALRVINDDVIKPSAGFDTHGHRDMEIITFVMKGVLKHKDSTGNVEAIPAGEYQLMSAGKGILHSEFNGSNTDDVQLLQIWIEPNVFGEKPGYQQKAFGQKQGITTIATPNGEGETFKIKQAAKLQQLILAPNSALEFASSIGGHLYVHVAAGELTVNDLRFNVGDAAKVTGEASLTFSNQGQEQVTALIFELP